jgi:cell division transport system permease protein
MSVACVVIITLSLLIFGIFLTATANLRELLRYAHEKVEIVAFLEDGLPVTAVDSLATALQAVDVVEQVRYVGPDEAMERLKSEFGTRSYLLEALPVNPLPASFEIRLKPRYRFKDTIETLSEQVTEMAGVEDVSYGKGWIARLERIVRAVAMADIGMGLVVAIAAIVTVSYTVRLTIYARREMIRILKLVGATDFFVMVPFLLEGALHGAMAVALALVLLLIGHGLVATKVPQAVFMSTGMIVFFVVFGVAVAMLGSVVSLRAFLKERARS